MSKFRTLRPGTSCGPYTILKQLGQGGSSIVYLAEGPNQERRAIKTLHFTRDLDRDKMRRFNREVEAVALIQHVNVVRFFDAGRVNSSGSGALMWMAQEYVEGVTLREVMHARAGTIEYDDVARWAAQIANGVAAAHKLGVVHRDLKPANIMLILGEVDLIKVIDFNVAKFHGWGTTTTGRRSVIGTMGYMAPEQLDPDRGPIDERTDVYALGLIIFELATGRSPLSPYGQDIYTLEVISRTITFEAPRLDEMIRGFPKALADIAEKAMHKDPAERFGSMSEMSEMLTDFIRSHNEQRVRAALASISNEEGGLRNQKRTVRMDLPEEVRSHPRAQARPVDQPLTVSPPASLEATVVLDPPERMRRDEAEISWRPQYAQRDVRRRWAAQGIGGLGGLITGLLFLSLVLPKGVRPSADAAVVAATASNFTSTSKPVEVHAPVPDAPSVSVSTILPSMTVPAVESAVHKTAPAATVLPRVLTPRSQPPRKRWPPSPPSAQPQPPSRPAFPTGDMYDGL